MSQPQRLKIALINVMKVGDYQYEQEIPLGLAYIGAFLRTHGREVLIKQCFAGKSEEEIDLAVAVEADLYGFQLNMVNYQAVKSVVEKIKTQRPKAITVFGGPFLATLSEEILTNEPLFDFMVIGEGEATILELIEAIEEGENEFFNIQGLAWRDKSQRIIINQSRPFIEDIDRFPFPARDFLEDAKRDPMDNGIVESIRVVTSRGCIGKCSFCLVNLYQTMQKGKIWRGRSPKNVVDELEYLSKEYQVKLVNFADSSFDDPGETGKERSREICEEILKRRIPLSAKIYLRCETMKSHEDIELLKLYKKAGIDVVIIGAESGSDYELRLYEKRATVEDNYRMAKILKDLDLFYVMSGCIMFGPNSTMETLRDNIKFMHQFGFADNLMVVSNVLMLIKDSKLYKILQAEGRVIDSENYWELPSYQFRDPLVKRLTKHWLNLYQRYPATSKVNQLQINIGNLVTRMTNPMNCKILDCLTDEFNELKKGYNQLSAEFGTLQRDFFLHTIELVEHDFPEEQLNLAMDDFFIKTYGGYLPLYDQLYNEFLDQVVKNGFSLSGLVFKHFISVMSSDSGARVEKNNLSC